MNASYWTFLGYMFVVLLRLSSSIFTMTLYSSQTLLAPTCATSYWRVRRASPPKYGKCHCIWIRRSTPFHSHRGSSFFPFLLPYFPDLVIRSLLLALHVQLVDKNLFLTNKQLASCCLKPCIFHSALRWPVYTRTSFCSDRSCMFDFPCNGPVYTLHHWRAHPVLIMFKFKPVSHLLALFFDFSLMVYLQDRRVLLAREMFVWLVIYIRFIRLFIFLTFLTTTGESLNGKYVLHFVWVLGRQDQETSQ